MNTTTATAYRPVFERLKDYYNLPESIEWMNALHPQLNNETPADAIRAGRSKEVHAILDRFDSSTYI